MAVLVVLPLVLALTACVTTDPNDPSITYGNIADCPNEPEDPIVTKCGYYVEVRRRIAAQWTYPEAQRLARQSGDVEMELAIGREGTLKSVRVLQSSGVPALDEHMERVIKAAAPFPPLGSYFEKETLTITGSFRFRLD